MLLPFLTSVRRACATRLRYALRILTLPLGTSVTVARIVSSIRYQSAHKCEPNVHWLEVVEHCPSLAATLDTGVALEGSTSVQKSLPRWGDSNVA